MLKVKLISFRCDLLAVECRTLLRKHVWPSGLRRQTQDLVDVSPREFKPHRMQTFYFLNRQLL